MCKIELEDQNRVPIALEWAPELHKQKRFSHIQESLFGYTNSTAISKIRETSETAVNSTVLLTTAWTCMMEILGCHLFFAYHSKSGVGEHLYPASCDAHRQEKFQGCVCAVVTK